MKDVLAAADALPAGSHTNLREIADLVAIDLVYKLRDDDRRPRREKPATLAGVKQ